MTEFRNWEDDVVGEFLKVAEAAVVNAIAHPEARYGMRVAADLVKTANYSALKDSLRNTLEQARVEKDLAVLQGEQWERSAKAVAKECNQKDEAHARELKYYSDGSEKVRAEHELALRSIEQLLGALDGKDAQLAELKERRDEYCEDADLVRASKLLVRKATRLLQMEKERDALVSALAEYTGMVWNGDRFYE